MAPSKGMQMTLSDRINGETRAIGGILRCETCGRMKDLGDVGLRVTAVGWPKCHDLTMRWWTQRQIDSGEMNRARTGR